jgi:hypothetical protein
MVTARRHFMRTWNRPTPILASRRMPPSPPLAGFDPVPASRRRGQRVVTRSMRWPATKPLPARGTGPTLDHATCCELQHACSCQSAPVCEDAQLQRSRSGQTFASAAARHGLRRYSWAVPGWSRR